MVRPAHAGDAGPIPLEEETATTPVFLPGEFHGQRSLVSYSLWDGKESDMTEQLTLSFPSQGHLDFGFIT